MLDLKKKHESKKYQYSTFLTNTILKILAKVMNQETEIKEMQMGNEKVKLFIFANMILFIIDP